ncbi:MAG TPA: ABC transporter substrate-binding protein [Candidatus Limnocylindrales bacterium]|nr:ABC transporter substrate-binding protein [Candidatus Limnocylindrales bacterium]
MRTSLGALSLVAVLAAACAGPAATPTGTITATPPSPGPTTAPTPTPDACAKDKLALTTPGKLTVGTDNPAYPPYFGGDPPADGTWEVSDPRSGKGFESAVAYAIAEKLGFSKDEVVWVVVPFANSYAPGPKAFDFDINQVSYKPERAQAADLSDGYYFGNQTVVALKGSPVAAAKSVADLKPYQFGAQAGTTSYDAIVEVIKPDKETRVYDSNDAAIEALSAKLVNGVVVDLPTAYFITTVQVENATIVGQLPQGEQEYFSLVLAKGSPLTPCVNAAIAALKADGTLAKLEDEWLPFKGTPTLAP